MARLLREFRHRHIRTHLRPFERWRVASLGGIAVHYQKHLDGGGLTFGQNFIPFLLDRGMPRQPRVFEWCSGPGFIAFSMLGYGLCDTLCLADINPRAVKACRRTVAANHLADRVAVYHSDNLAGIPASERWDLVVSNPPHFDGKEAGELRFCDLGWALHRSFFASVAAFLKPGGVIVLQENNQGSTADVFRDMIAEAGLTIAFVHGCEPKLTPYPRYYYIGITRRGDVVPAWAA